MGEIRKGITSHPDAARRVKVEAWLSRYLKQRFVGRILSSDENVADRWSGFRPDRFSSRIVSSAPLRLASRIAENVGCAWLLSCLVYDIVDPA